MTANSNSTAGIPNEVFNLVSVLYRALESAATYEQYIQDAASQQDEELSQFFRDAQQNHRQVAVKARQLLSQRLGSEQSDQTEYKVKRQTQVA